MTNNEAYSVMGKYTFEFGGGYKDGCGLKDVCDTSKLTFYGGYQAVNQTNYNGPNGGGTTLGGYNLHRPELDTDSTRVLHTAWVGAKYETGAWAFTGAGTISPRITGADTITTRPRCSLATQSLPTHEQATTRPWSFLVDYAFNKNFDHLFQASATRKSTAALPALGSRQVLMPQRTTQRSSPACA